MKTIRNYNYDTRTLATWYYNKIMENQGSYYALYKRLSEDTVARSEVEFLMKYIDKFFCDGRVKVSLLKKAILYVLGSSIERPLSRREIINTVVNRLEVSPQVLEKATKSGRTSSLESEISWEIYHLRKEGKITRISRGYYRVS